MKRKVVFHSTRNHEICGILSDPANDRNRPAVLMCHGLTTSKDGRTYVRLEEILNGKKFSTFRFDFFGHGESEGDFADRVVIAVGGTDEDGRPGSGGVGQVDVGGEPDAVGGGAGEVEQWFDVEAGALGHGSPPGETGAVQVSF